MGIEFAETGFTYAKAYVLLLLVLGVLSLWFSIEFWKVIVLLVLAAIVGLSCMIRYSHLYQRLVKHDVRRFISMEMYRKDPEDGTIKLIEPAAVGTGDVALPSAPPAEKRSFVGRFLARLLLRFEDSGILYATKVVYFGARG